MTGTTKARIAIGTMGCGVVFLAAQVVLNAPENLLTRLVLVLVLVQLALALGAILQFFTETR
jgi:hypothetical protein